VVGPAGTGAESQLSEVPKGDPKETTDVRLALFLSHSTDMAAGIKVQVGAELSKIVMNCVEVETLLHSSRAFQVLTIDEKHTLGVNTSLELTVTLIEHASETWIVPVVGADVNAGLFLLIQLTLVFGAEVIVGADESLTWTICTELLTRFA